MEEKRGIKALASLRVMLGLWLVWLTLPNLDRSFLERFPDMLASFAYSNPIPFCRWVIYNVAIPYAEQIGTALSVGGILVASALVIGFFTRAVALLGIAYATGLLFVTSHLSSFHQGVAILLMILFITLIIGDAGRCFGIDGLLFKQQDKAPKKLKFKHKKQREVVESLSQQIKEQSSKGKGRKSSQKVKT